MLQPADTENTHDAIGSCGNLEGSLILAGTYQGARRMVWRQCFVVFAVHGRPAHNLAEIVAATNGNQPMGADIQRLEQFLEITKFDHGDHGTLESTAAIPQCSGGNQAISARGPRYYHLGEYQAGLRVIA